MKMLIPDVIVESVLKIDLDDLKNRQISGLLIDIDNTLVPWGVPQMEDAFLSWVKDAKDAGFKICLVSNALEERVESFASLLEIPAVGRALKPFSRAFRRGMKLLNLPSHEVAIIGDQLFTDIYGGKRLGLYTILINPLSTTELGVTKLMRQIEKKTLARMARRGHISSDSIRVRQGRD